jgi:hypothetical protein
MVKVDGSGGNSRLIQVHDLNKKYRRGGEEFNVLQWLPVEL